MRRDEDQAATARHTLQRLSAEIRFERSEMQTAGEAQNIELGRQEKSPADSLPGR
jgi:hypothetical protein